MTSNLGSQVIQELAGEANYARMKAAVMEIVGQHFRPEFINRVDEVVVFHPLGREHIREIVEIQLGYLRRRLADRDIGLELDDAATRPARRGGVRPGVRRAPAQARDPAPAREPAGAADPARRVRARATRSVSRRMRRRARSSYEAAAPV